MVICLAKIVDTHLGDPRLIEIANSWLQTHAANTGWSYIFQSLFNADIREQWMLQRGLEGMAHSPMTVADPYLWQVIDTLGGNTSQLACFIISRLCKFPTTYIQQKAIQWMSPRREQIEEQSIAYTLREQMAEPAWVFVWQRCLEIFPNALELPSLGCDWLTNREDRQEWNYVWRSCLELCPDDLDLPSLGCAWLVNREERPEWPFIWQRCLELFPDDPTLPLLGRAWLVNREERPE